MTLSQSLFSFRGRINRERWWLTHGLIVAITVIIYFIFLILGDTGTVFFLLFGICHFWARLAVNAKRWHDRNKSAWWLLIELIPLIGSIWTCVELGFLKGTYGRNRFGRDPLEHA